MTDNSRLKSYIDRIEELATEKAAINDGIRDIFTEVKSAFGRMMLDLGRD